MATINTHTLYDWHSRDTEFTLVDTLPRSAFDKVHLPGAINIVSDDIYDLAPNRLPDTDEPIVVYCASDTCRRAERAAERLTSLGYTRVYHYVGGKKAWQEEGLPLERPKQGN